MPPTLALFFFFPYLLNPVARTYNLQVSDLDRLPSIRKIQAVRSIESTSYYSLCSHGDQATCVRMALAHVQEVALGFPIVRRGGFAPEQQKAEPLADPAHDFGFEVSPRKNPDI
jgi:hypothetical protein